MTNITGVRTTNNILQNRRVVDMAKQIALLDPNEGPLLSFLKLAKNNSRCVYNPKFEWLEDDLMETWSSVTAVSYTHLDVYKRQGLCCG